MSTKRKGIYTRRQFVSRGLTGAGLCAAVLSRGTSPAQASEAPRKANPFAYPSIPEPKIDPQLLNYEQVAQFKCPRPEAKRLACGPSGTIYVAAGKYVTILDQEGRVGSEIALGAPARCLAVAPDGTTYISLRDHVEVFDAQGQRRAVWETPADRTWFTGLALGANDLYAADAGNRVVIQYDRSGKVVRRLGEKDPARRVPGLVAPSPFLDVELGADGLLRVSNPGRHQIESYTPGGDLELVWGRPSSAVDGFCGCCNPINLGLLPDGGVVTCEKGIPRVKVYTAQGRLESVVAGPQLFPESAKVTAADHAEHIWGGLDVAADAQGRIYILDWATGALRVMARKASA